MYLAIIIIRMIKSGTMTSVGHVEHMEAMIDVYKIVVRKPEGKRQLGRTRHKWEDTIKMLLRRDSKMCGCGLDSSGSI
jgi:hypothetical protein